MKKWIFIWGCMMTTTCFAQDLEFCGTYSIASDQRFQNATGIGLQYQNDLGKYWRIGVGMYYNANTASYDETFLTNDNSTTVFKMTAEPHRFTIRVNALRLIPYSKMVSIYLGPEISYNSIWEKDQIVATDEAYSDYNNTTDIPLTNYFGAGIVCKVEVKPILDPHLSLVLTFLPELITDGVAPKGSINDAQLMYAFMEFQIGLKYRFKN